MYNQINEDEVYDPSGHEYNEIEDEGASGGSKPVVDSSQTDDNMYNQINEDEVYYDPSGHEYYEIKDENASGGGREEYDGINDMDNAPGQTSPNEEHENDDGGSVRFYAATAEVELPTNRNVGAETLLYKSGTKKVASVNPRMESLSVSESTGRDQTAYESNECWTNCTDMYISGTTDDVAIRDAIEHEETRQLERQDVIAEDSTLECVEPELEQ
ncbi:regulation of response to stimulus [Branchiostoma belcheri]|nr:regulation of response to stimulus [Branchiostoma belcheri]